MNKVLIIYYCVELYCPRGRLSCLMKKGEMIDLVYCAEKRCNQECGIGEYLTCLCYTHQCKEVERHEKLASTQS